MSCLRLQPVSIPMDTVKIIQTEKFPPLRREPPRAAWPSESEVIVNQGCGELALDGGGAGAGGTPPAPSRRERVGYLSQRKPSAAELCFHNQFHCKAADDVIVNQYVLRSASGTPCEPLECPTCGHTYNLTGKRPRILSCLHSVCEECLQILYESCPKYKFISCPTCRRETVLFTDYGLAALAVNTSILNRLPAEAGLGPSNPVQWGGDSDRSCYQTVRQYCQSACTCQLANPLSSCAIM
ncbi:RING finger protein 208-like [Huso huso]|uniref:RING finger protein 208-like n=1 Tax=Huso huso TaxID=61971 RepID=A0ABR0Z845_HUSHU